VSIDEKLFLTISDVARVLHLGFDAAKGVFNDLPQLRIGQRLMVRRSDLDRFIKGEGA
jgi:hypothetical protein